DRSAVGRRLSVVACRAHAAVCYIIIYRTADAKRGGGRGPPRGVVDGVFGVWLPTFERPGGGGEGGRSQDRRYRTGRRRTRADCELRGLRPGDEDRGRGQYPHHEGPPTHGLRRSRPRMMARRCGGVGGAAEREPGRGPGASKTVE